MRVVVVMRILPQPFTSFGCHGYTAGGPELLDTEAGTEREGEGCWEAWPSEWLPCFSFHASTKWTWHVEVGRERGKKNKTSSVLELSVRVCRFDSSLEDADRRNSFISSTSTLSFSHKIRLPFIRLKTGKLQGLSSS